MAYRVRKQAITGKLVLQTGRGLVWTDCKASDIAYGSEFWPVTTKTHSEMQADLYRLHGEATILRARVERYERRALAQKNSRRNRGAQPAADAASAKESEPC